MSTRENPQERAELKRIRNDDERLVNFSKRRADIYKKASEMNILCGAQVGIIIFSPSNKPFMYGAPNIEAVVNRFSRKSDQAVVDLKTTAFEAQKNSKVQEINDMLNKLTNRKDLSKKEGIRLSEIKAPIEHQFWWNAPLITLNPENMEKLIEPMKRFKDGVTKIDEKFMEIESTINATNIASSSVIEKRSDNAMNIESSSN